MSNILIISYALFNYFPRNTGSVQEFVATNAGTYKLEIWGAQGGGIFDGGQGGYGGYSYGNIKLKWQNLIYIYVGGSGTSGGFNGGGNGDARGGGATNIAVSNKGTLNNYISSQNDILIVAGGGGGGERVAGGNGGGENGNQSTDSTYPSGAGGNQTSGGLSVSYSVYSGSSTLVNGTFGQGGCGYTPLDYGSDYGGGGGGGWYGGGGTSYAGAGGGGSGHINANYVINGSMQNGIRVGDGYAKITQISY